MRFLALSAFLFCFSTFLFADANEIPPQPQSVPNQQTTISENQQLWLANQIIEINKDIAKLETQIAFKAESSNTLDNLKSALRKIQSEQSRLAIKFEQIDVNNNRQYLAQNDRISDIGSKTTMWGIIFTILTVVIALAAILLGFSAKNDAVSEAKTVAENEAKEVAEIKFTKWIEENETKIVDAVVIRTENKLSEVTALKEMFEEYKSKTDKQFEDLRERTSQYDKPPAEEDIKQLEKNLANKTEDEYSPEDWFDKASTAYYSENYDESILFLNKVINDVNSAELLIAKSLVNKGLALAKLKQPEEEIAVYEAVVLRFGTSDKLGLHKQVAKALLNKGVVLDELKQTEKAIAAYENIVARFGERTELALQVLVAQALVYQGIEFAKLEQSEKAIAIFENVVLRFADSDELALQEQVAKALLNKGVVLDELKHAEKAIATYENIVVRFGERTELALQVLVAPAFVYQGIELAKLEQSEKAIAIFENVVSRFADSDELDLQVQVANSLVNQGVVLAQLKQVDKAITVYEDVVARFSESEKPVLQSYVADAIVNAVEVSLLCGDKQGTKSRIEHAKYTINKDSLNFTIMKFMQFLIDDIPLVNMIEQIDKLPSDTEFTWSFDEIRGYLAELTGDKKQQAEAIADFFENHHDITELKKRLANYL